LYLEKIIEKRLQPEAPFLAFLHDAF